MNVKLADPHERIIVATAKLLNARLITKDEKIRNSKIVETIW
jgi:PIN domain nuclease of toxin-antitoxin system